PWSSTLRCAEGLRLRSQPQPRIRSKCPGDTGNPSHCFTVRRSTRAWRSESETERKYCSASLYQNSQRAGRENPIALPAPGPPPIHMLVQILPLESIVQSPDTAEAKGVPTNCGAKPAPCTEPLAVYTTSRLPPDIVGPAIAC